MDSDRRKSIRERIALDGLRYELMASPHGTNNYLGEWLCPTCDRGGTSVTSYPHVSNALDWARGCVDCHHKAVHGG